MSERETMRPTPPQYRGFRGAALYGLAVFAFMAALGVAADFFLGGVHRGPGQPLQVGGRLALIGAILGVSAALSRWLARTQWNSMFAVKVLPGDYSAIGFLAGALVAGYMTMQAGPPTPLQQNASKDGPMEITGPTLDGGKYDLAEHRGKVVLVDFWATWCGPCRAELPNVKATYDEFHAKGFDVVGISLDHSRTALTRFLEASPLPWPQIYFEADGGLNPLVVKYGINAIPAVFLIGKDGNVIGQNLRGPALRAGVAKALGLADSAGAGAASIEQRETGAWNKVGSGAWMVFVWGFVGLLHSPAWMLAAYGIGGSMLALGIELLLRRRASAAPV